MFAADAARITDERASLKVESIRQENFLWQSTATWEQLWEWKNGTIESIPGNEGRIAKAWVTVRGGWRVLSVYVWHSEGWTPRNEALLEAVLKQTRTTRHTWLIGCDANMCPEDVEKCLWFQSERMHVVAPKEASTCRWKGPKGEWIERIYDYVVAGSLKGKISQMEVVEVSFVDEREKELLEWNEQKLPKVTVEEGGQGEAQRKRQRRRGGRKGQHRETSEV